MRFVCENDFAHVLTTRAITKDLREIGSVYARPIVVETRQFCELCNRDAIALSDEEYLRVLMEKRS